MANEVGGFGVAKEGARGDGVAQEERSRAAETTGFNASHSMLEGAGEGEACGDGMTEDGIGEDGLGVSMGEEVNATDGGAVGEWVEEERMDGEVQVGVVERRCGESWEGDDVSEGRGEGSECRYW